MWPTELAAQLNNCPTESIHWAGLGYRVGVEDGRSQIMQALSDAGRETARSARSYTSSDRPSWDELLQRRQTVHEYCGRRCLACSSCIAAEAWERRGGRPFLGVEAERQLQGAA